jgi:hypothetical protein
MKRLLFLVGMLAALTASAQQAAYQIDLVPSGNVLSKDVPVVKGGMYLFHGYPNGTLMSLRPSQVKGLTKITPDPALTSSTGVVIAIGNLAMQGGSQAGPTNASAVKSKNASNKPELGEGFYSNLKMGESLAQDAGRSGDYAIGRAYAYAPATASQSSPGAPPTMPSATNGTNPPTMSGTASGTNPQ